MDSNPPAAPRPRKRSGLAGRVLIACLMLWGAVYFVLLPLIGLFTGHLLLLGRGSSSGWTDGVWARIISALLLLVAAYFFYWVMKSRTTKPGAPD